MNNQNPALLIVASLASLLCTHARETHSILKRHSFVLHLCQRTIAFLGTVVSKYKFDHIPLDASLLTLSLNAQTLTSRVWRFFQTCI